MAPPCDDCRPRILAANGPAMAAFELVSDQWQVSAMGERLGLSLPAVESAVRILGHANDLALIQDVLLIGREIAGHQARAREQKRERSR